MCLSKASNKYLLLFSLIPSSFCFRQPLQGTTSPWGACPEPFPMGKGSRAASTPGYLWMAVPGRLGNAAGSGNAQGVPHSRGCRRQLAPGSDRLLMAAARGASSCDIHRWGGGENSFYPLLWSHDELVCLQSLPRRNEGYFLI